MRYGQRGGYTPAEQERRERLRLEAAGRFARGDPASAIAAELRVTDRTIRRWRQAWRDGGTAALRSRGPVSRERLSPRHWARLEAELRRGPLAHGLAGDQRWTLGRIKTLTGKLFHIGVHRRGTWKLMRRHGRVLVRCDDQVAVILPGEPFGSLLRSSLASRRPTC